MYKYFIYIYFVSFIYFYKIRFFIHIYLMHFYNFLKFKIITFTYE